MKPPPLFLRYAQGGPWLVLLIVILLALWGLAEMHDRQRQLAPRTRCGHGATSNLARSSSAGRIPSAPGFTLSGET